MVFFFQILCVLGLVSAGFFARRRGLLSAHGTNDLAHVALSIVYPALIFVSILELSFADLHIGGELAMPRREGCGGAPALWAGLRPAYFEALSVSRPRRAHIHAACGAAIGQRMVRTIIQGKSSWS